MSELSNSDPTKSIRRIAALPAAVIKGIGNNFKSRPITSIGIRQIHRWWNYQWL